MCTLAHCTYKYANIFLPLKTETTTKKRHNCDDLVRSLPPTRHYKMSVLILCFLVPTLVPWYFWGESMAVGYFVPGLLRYVLVLNATWLVNSAAHMWGNRPYDKTINPRENPLVALTAIGKETTGAEGPSLPQSGLRLASVMQQLVNPPDGCFLCPLVV